MNDGDEAVWRTFLTDVEPTENISAGNRLTHLRNEDRALRAIWSNIEDAQERVWMSMYTLAPDEVGLGTIDRLAQAAARGCDVRLIYDYVGSIHLGKQHLEPLAEAGGRFQPFNRCWPPWKRNGPMRIRNHRKVILVDAKAALCGGLNLSEEYTRTPGGEWVFEDTVVLIEGPCILDLMSIFARTWTEFTDDPINLPSRPLPFDDGVDVQVLETDPRRSSTSLRAMLNEAVSRASQRCLIATPYFLPADWLTESLLDAASRGADVRIVTAGRIDVPPARAAARHAYGPLLEGGVRIFEMYGRMIHAKIVAIDGSFGTIGSYNFDRWTARHTLDTSIAVVGKEIAQSLEQEIDTFMEAASEYLLRDLNKRGLPTKALYWMADRLVSTV